MYTGCYSGAPLARLAPAQNPRVPTGWRRDLDVLLDLGLGGLDFFRIPVAEASTPAVAKCWANLGKLGFWDGDRCMPFCP